MMRNVDMRVILPFVGVAVTAAGIGLMSYMFMSFDSPGSRLKHRAERKARVRYEVAFDKVAFRDLVDGYQDAFAEGRFGDAKKCVLDVVKMIRNELGERHYLMGSMLYHLSDVCVAMGNYEEAKTALNSGIQILEESAKKNKFNLRMMYESKVQIDIEIEEYSSALIYAEKYKDTFKKNEEEKVFSHFLLGYVELYSGDLDKSLQIFEEVTPLMDNILGKQHDKMIYHYINYAELLSKLGRLGEAIQVLNECSEIDKHSRTSNGLRIIEKLGDLFLQKNDIDQAEISRTRCVDLSSNINVRKGYHLNNLATFYFNQGRDTDAENILSNLRNSNEHFLSKSVHLATHSYNVITTKGGKYELEIKLLFRTFPCPYEQYEYHLDKGGNVESGQGEIIYRSKSMFLSVPLDDDQTSNMIFIITLSTGKEKSTKHHQIIRISK